MKHGIAGDVADRSQHLTLDVVRLGEHRQGLGGMGCEYRRIESVFSARGGGDRDAIAVANDANDGGRQMQMIAQGSHDLFYVPAAASDHRSPRTTPKPE